MGPLRAREVGGGVKAKIGVLVVSTTKVSTPLQFLVVHIYVRQHKKSDFLLGAPPPLSGPTNKKIPLPPPSIASSPLLLFIYIYYTYMQLFFQIYTAHC